MLNKIIDLIYPPTCGICGKLNQNSLCKKCEIELKKQAVFGIDNYKKNCETFFDEHLYIFMYNGIIRMLILNYKFNDKSYLYKTFVKFLLKNNKFVEIIKSYDIIMPVPLNQKRKRKRGYNQSDLIAMEISNFLQIKLEKNNLEKVQNIVAQSTLNKVQRSQNIKGVYRIKNKQNLKNKKVLVIDDIYTTGSTINECSKIVKEAGAKNIGVLTIAKD